MNYFKKITTVHCLNLICSHPYVQYSHGTLLQKKKLYSTNSLLWFDHFFLLPFHRSSSHLRCRGFSFFIVCTFFRLESKSEGPIASHKKGCQRARHAAIHVSIWDKRQQGGLIFLGPILISQEDLKPQKFLMFSCGLILFLTSKRQFPSLRINRK